MKDNLLFLYNETPAPERESGRQWYSRANGLITARAEEHGYNLVSAVAAYAALSPAKDWYMNVALGDRLLDIYKNRQNHVWDDKMDKTGTRLWTELKGKKPATEANEAVFKAIQGKSLSELTDPVEKGAWIRTYDEAHSPDYVENGETYYKIHRVITPYGSYGDLARNNDGTPKSYTWPRKSSVTTAINCLEANGDRRKISDAFGAAHKVRSFYNNILDPESLNGDFTIDTHAVGAALLRPLSRSKKQVRHNFDATYSLYSDAYREAAKELGIPPQQFQAIIWESKRKLFNKLKKADVDAIDNAWKQYENDKTSLDETRNAIFRIARGCSMPTRPSGALSAFSTTSVRINSVRPKRGDRSERAIRLDAQRAEAINSETLDKIAGCAGTHA